MPTIPAITPEIQQSVQDYFSKHPDQAEVFARDYGSDLGRWLEAFTGWWDANGGNVSDLGPYQDEIGLLGTLGFNTAQTGAAGGPNDTPAEQALYNAAVPQITADIARDVDRRGVADTLAKNLVGAGTNVTNLIGRTQGGGFDSVDYYNRYPNVQQLFASLNDGATPGTKSVPTPQGPKDMTPEQFGEFHFTNFGQREGLTANYVPSPQLAQDISNANQTVQANIGALQQWNDEAVKNLSGNLAAKATAITQLTATLNEQLTTLDASQKKILTDQIAALQANLETSVAAQRRALEQQLASLGAAAGTEAAARRAALQQEIAALTAAQAPLAEARVQAADLQATAINVGLERTKDELTAEQARQGYVGGSTIGDASLARATVDARQKAAEAMAGARLANAADTREIGVRGATGERSIAEALAGSNRDIANLGARGTFDLSTGLAKGTQGISDTGATGMATIAGNTALGRAGIGAQGANRTFQDQVFGADQQRSLADTLAAGKLGEQQKGNAAIATYKDNDFARQLSGLLLTPQITSTTATGLRNLDEYANSGLTRGLNTLNWWSTPTSAPPTPGYVPNQPSNAGNDLSNLGAGIVNLVGNLGTANNWWQPAKTTTTKVPAPTGGTGFTGGFGD